MRLMITLKFVPDRLEVKMVSDLGCKMEGPKSFFQVLEKRAPDFYVRVCQHSWTWGAHAPKVAKDNHKSDGEDECNDPTESEPENLSKERFVDRNQE